MILVSEDAVIETSVDFLVVEVRGIRWKISAAGMVVKSGQSVSFRGACREVEMEVAALRDACAAARIEP